MTLVLPQGKVTAIKHLCTQIISLKEVTVCDIARLIGKLTAFIQAFFSSPSPLSPITELEIQSPSIEGDLRYPSQSQSSMSGRTTMVAGSPRCLEWPVHIDSPTRPSDRNRCIETGLVGGGGTACMDMRTGGLWSQNEHLLHINCLELLAGAFAVKCFAKNQICLHIRFRMDSTTAIAYINKLGGTLSLVLSNPVADLWT